MRQKIRININRFNRQLKLMQASQGQISLNDSQFQLAKQIETSKLIEQKIKEAIQKIGNANRYQVILIIYLVFCFIFATFLLVGTSYFFMNPNFICNGVSFFQEEACKQLQNCVLQNSYTITAYTELYCDHKTIERNWIQAMLGVGSCLGVLFINFVSDYKGRRFSFLISLVSGIFSIVTLLIGAYTRTLGWFYFSEILAGFCGNSLLTLVYVMSDHLMSKKYSSQCILITNAFFGLAEIAFILFTGPLNWQHLSILFMLVPSFGLLGFAYFLIIEDPVYLFNKNKIDECKKSLEIIAIFNNNKHKLVQSYEIIDLLRKNHVQLDSSEQQQKKPSSKLKYLRILLKREFIVPIVSIGLFNLGGNLFYYVLNYSISNTGSSFGTEIVLFGIVEFVGIFPMMAYGDKTPRKYGLIFIVVFGTLLSLSFIFDLSIILQTIVIVTIRFSMVSLYMLYIFLVVETFPQHIQATCFGIVQFISQIGKLLAPFTVTIAEGINISPILLGGFLMISFMLIPLIPVKETLVKKKEEEERNQHQKSLIEN